MSPGSGAPGGSTQFVVNVANIIRFLRERTMHSILTERYHEEENEANHGVCARIYQVLLHAKYAEQNQVADLAMIPMKEARIHLYQMYKDKYIMYQEVPRRDHNPETTIFLWCVNNSDEKFAVVVEDLHKSMLNLRLRQEHEIGELCVWHVWYAFHGVDVLISACASQVRCAPHAGTGCAVCLPRTQTDPPRPPPPPAEVHKDMLEHEEQHEQDEHEAEKVRAFKEVRNRLDQAIVNLDEMVLMFEADI